MIGRRKIIVVDCKKNLTRVDFVLTNCIKSIYIYSIDLLEGKFLHLIYRWK